MSLPTHKIVKEKVDACGSIPEFLAYLVECMGNNLYKNKMILKNLIKDYFPTKREIRLYCRAIDDNEIPSRLLEILKLDENEQEMKLQILISQFCEDNRYNQCDGATIISAFAQPLGLHVPSELVNCKDEPIITNKIIIIDDSALMTQSVIILDLLRQFHEVIIPNVAINILKFQSERGRFVNKERAKQSLSILDTIRDQITFVGENTDSTDVLKTVTELAINRAEDENNEVFILSKNPLLNIPNKPNNIKILEI